MQYRTDIEYIASFNARQAPPVMNYTAALAGFDPIDLSQPFRYCDLGCGPGLTLLTLAAAFPHAEFVGVDFNSNHIRMAQARAEATGLQNVKLVHSNFTELKDRNLPQFHFIAISGTLSWLADAPRDAVLDFMGNNLVEGGLAYLHYMVMPGHAIQPPLCRLASDYYNQLEGEPEEKVLLTKEFLKGFLNTQKRYFEISPTAKDFLQNMINSSTSLFLHDYLSNVRKAYYFADMNQLLEQRGLRYAGSAEPFYNHLQLVVPIESRELFRGVRERASVEAIKDYICVNGGRTDVFCKTNRSAGSEKPLESVLVVALPGQDQNQVINFAGTAVRLNVDPMATVLRVLQTPSTLEKLYQHPELSAYPRHEIRKALTYAVAARRVIPIVTPPSPVTSISAYNRDALSQVVTTAPDLLPSVTLASPVMGSGHCIGWVDAVMLWSIVNHGIEAPQKALEIMQKRNLALKVQTKDEKELTPQETMKLAIQNSARQFNVLLPFMGISPNLTV
ncbi:MAG: class I SAM-dependent methyltransferase [Pseudanabaenaceae cyanobacterium SKYGB_i_bin29]|nr:class I SAM-dependent methyltransferase [Pseudanabaenaceae cyanobacterium SKYG29]MDW8420413.1 class I SAM-dependent methyltransferase [Pseudanabaenaceae cyanobacterium SKYGB_i_bin29]